MGTLLAGVMVVGTAADSWGAGSTFSQSAKGVATGTLGVIKCQLKVANPGFTDVKLAMYDATGNADSPGARLAGGSVDDLAAAKTTGVFQFTVVAGPTITLNGDYHFGIYATGETPNFQGDASGGVQYETNGAIPDPFNASGGPFGSVIAVWAETAGVAPSNTVAPAVTGTPSTGEIVSCSTGTWTGDATITYAYQWKRAGSSIGGATSSTYTLQVADEGQSVKCTVTATNSAGNASADSNTITPSAASTDDSLIRVDGEWVPGDRVARVDGEWV